MESSDDEDEVVIDYAHGLVQPNAIRVPRSTPITYPTITTTPPQPISPPYVRNSSYAIDENQRYEPEPIYQRPCLQRINSQETTELSRDPERGRSRGPSPDRGRSRDPDRGRSRGPSPDRGRSRDPERGRSRGPSPDRGWSRGQNPDRGRSRGPSPGKSRSRDRSRSRERIRVPSGGGRRDSREERDRGDRSDRSKSHGQSSSKHQHQSRSSSDSHNPSRSHSTSNSNSNSISRHPTNPSRSDLAPTTTNPYLHHKVTSATYSSVEEAKKVEARLKAKERAEAAAKEKIRQQSQNPIRQNQTPSNSIQNRTPPEAPPNNTIQQPNRYPAPTPTPLIQSRPTAVPPAPVVPQPNMPAAPVAPQPNMYDPRVRLRLQREKEQREKEERERQVANNPQVPTSHINSHHLPYNISQIVSKPSTPPAPVPPPVPSVDVPMPSIPLPNLSTLMPDLFPPGFNYMSPLNTNQSNNNTRTSPSTNTANTTASKSSITPGSIKPSTTARDSNMNSLSREEDAGRKRQQSGDAGDSNAEKKKTLNSGNKSSNYFHNPTTDKEKTNADKSSQREKLDSTKSKDNGDFGKALTEGLKKATNKPTQPPNPIQIPQSQSEKGKELDKNKEAQIPRDPRKRSINDKEEEKKKEQNKRVRLDNSSSSDASTSKGSDKGGVKHHKEKEKPNQTSEDGKKKTGPNPIAVQRSSSESNDSSDEMRKTRSQKIAKKPIEEIILSSDDDETDDENMIAIRNDIFEDVEDDSTTCTTPKDSSTVTTTTFLPSQNKGNSVDSSKEPNKASLEATKITDDAQAKDKQNSNKKSTEETPKAPVSSNQNKGNPKGATALLISLANKGNPTPTPASKGKEGAPLPSPTPPETSQPNKNTVTNPKPSSGTKESSLTQSGKPKDDPKRSQPSSGLKDPPKVNDPPSTGIQRPNESQSNLFKTPAPPVPSPPATKETPKEPETTKSGEVVPITTPSKEAASAPQKTNTPSPADPQKISESPLASNILPPAPTSIDSSPMPTTPERNKEIAPPPPQPRPPTTETKSSEPKIVLMIEDGDEPASDKKESLKDPMFIWEDIKEILAQVLEQAKKLRVKMIKGECPKKDYEEERKNLEDMFLNGYKRMKKWDSEEEECTEFPHIAVEEKTFYFFLLLILKKLLKEPQYHILMAHHLQYTLLKILYLSCKPNVPRALSAIVKCVDSVIKGSKDKSAKKNLNKKEKNEEKEKEKGKERIPLNFNMDDAVVLCEEIKAFQDESPTPILLKDYMNGVRGFFKDIYDLLAVVGIHQQEVEDNLMELTHIWMSEYEKPLEKRAKENKINEANMRLSLRVAQANVNLAEEQKEIESIIRAQVQSESNTISTSTNPPASSNSIATLATPDPSSASESIISTPAPLPAINEPTPPPTPEITIASLLSSSPVIPATNTENVRVETPEPIITTESVSVIPFTSTPPPRIEKLSSRMATITLVPSSQVQSKVHPNPGKTTTILITNNTSLPPSIRVPTGMGVARRSGTPQNNGTKSPLLLSNVTSAPPIPALRGMSKGSPNPNLNPPNLMSGQPRKGCAIRSGVRTVGARQPNPTTSIRNTPPAQIQANASANVRMRVLAGSGISYLVRSSTPNTTRPASTLQRPASTLVSNSAPSINQPRVNTPPPVRPAPQALPCTGTTINDLMIPLRNTSPPPQPSEDPLA